MKNLYSLMVATMFAVVFAASGVSCAGVVDFTPSIDRLEFDFAVPAHLQKADFTSTSSFVQNLTLSSDFRFGLLGSELGKIGIEGMPVWDVRNANLDANFGIYYEPFGIKYIQLHYDHDMNVSTTHIQNMSWKGNDVIGVRLVIKE